MLVCRMRFSRILLVVLGIGSLLNAGPRGVLEFQDGNRVTGELSEMTADQWVFKSDRFGELRPARSEAIFRPEHVVTSIPQEAPPVPRIKRSRTLKSPPSPTIPGGDHTLCGAISTVYSRATLVIRRKRGIGVARGVGSTWS